MGGVNALKFMLLASLAPLLASPTRGEVGFRSLGKMVPKAQCSTSPLVGEDGRGVSLDSRPRGSRPSLPLVGRVARAAGRVGVCLSLSRSIEPAAAYPHPGAARQPSPQGGGRGHPVIASNFVGVLP
jgi:hypothetical protein